MASPFFRRCSRFVVLALFFSLLLAAIPARPISAVALSVTPQPPAFAADVLLFGLHDGVSPANLDPAFQHAAGIRAIAAIPGMPDLYRAQLVPGQDVELAVQLLAGDPVVAFAEPDYLAHSSAVPGDPQYGEQWGLTRINAPAAWDVGTGSGTVVAIIDSGIDTAHPDLQSRLWQNPGEIAGNGLDDDNNGFVDDIHGWNLLDNNADLSDASGHGTQVAGVIAAAANNAAGGAGLCWDCRLMVVKVTRQSGTANYSDIAAGVQYAAQKGADVINISLAGASDSVALRNAIAAAAPRAVIVAGAGNNNNNAPAYPAAYNEHVLAVTATNQSDGRVASASYGNWVDVAAPGENILTTFSGGGYGSASGTSVGAPFAAGLAGLLHAAHPDWSPAQVRAQIMQTATNIDAANPDVAGQLGSGRIDAGAAMSSPARPAPMVARFSVDGQAGGRPEPGATVSLMLTLHNHGAAMQAVQGTLLSNGAATVVAGSSRFGDLPALGSAGNVQPFQVTVDGGAGYNAGLNFTLRLSDAAGGSYDLPFSITTSPGVTVAPATISGDVTWTADRLYLVNGDSGIPAGSTLRIQPGTEIRFAANANLIVNGTLIADGTAEQPIRFIAQQSDAPWGRIRFEDSSVDASYTAEGEYSSGSIVRHALIEDAGGIELANGHPYIAANRFYVVKDENYLSPPPTVMGAIGGSADGTLRIEQNEFFNRGVIINNGSNQNIVLTENRFSDASIYLQGDYGEPLVAEITGNTLTGSSNADFTPAAILASSGKFVISHNRIRGFKNGMHVASEQLLLSENLITSVGEIGIVLHGSNLDIRNNTLLNSGKTALVLDGIDIPTTTVVSNSLVPRSDGEALRLSGNNGQTVPVTGNYWGYPFRAGRLPHF